MRSAVFPPIGSSLDLFPFEGTYTSKPKTGFNVTEAEACPAASKAPWATKSIPQNVIASA